jgi:hypothetical protein
VSIASMWDEKLRRHAEHHPDPGNMLYIRPADLRALVDDALELEIVRRTPLSARVAELETEKRHWFESTKERCAKVLERGDREGWGADRVLAEVRALQMNAEEP